MTTETRRPRGYAAPLTGDWTSAAACGPEDRELFFPIAHSPGWRKQTQKAKEVCAGCPVREACLTWALETGQSSGVWGGLAEGERKTLRRGGTLKDPARRKPGPRGEVLQRCLDQQEWIEEQRTAGVSLRQLEKQMGVSRTVICQALGIFEAERQQQGAQGVAPEGVRAG